MLFAGYFSVTLYCGIGLPGFAVVVAGSLFSIAGMVASLFIIDKVPVSYTLVSQLLLFKNSFVSTHTQNSYRTYTVRRNGISYDIAL